MKLRLGTRASKLAQWQANWVATQLQKLGTEVELVLISTTGDQNQEEPIESLSGQGVFTKEIQKALVKGQIDVAVHSLKDLSTQPVQGLTLAAVPKRASVEDALISRNHFPLTKLHTGAIVGTGSLRRRTQLLNLRPDLVITDIRGNVDTRIAKLDAGDYDAILLATAGLERLGLVDRITETISTSTMLPAVGQGALGIETREDDKKTRSIVEHLDDPATHVAVRAERSLLKDLEGGCRAPIAAWAQLKGSELSLTARVVSLDGKKCIEASGSIKLSTAAVSEAAASERFSMADLLGLEVSATLYTKGAEPIIDQCRE